MNKRDRNRAKALRRSQRNTAARNKRTSQQRRTLRRKAANKENTP
jgi:hypothetical protein